MKIVNVIINGVYTDGYSYQENLLPKYHKLNGNDTYIITSNNKFSTGDNIVKVECGEYLDENGVKIIRLPLKNNKSVTAKIKKLIGLYKKLEEISPDVIFYHLFQSIDVKTIVKYKKKHPSVRVFFDSHADFSNSAHTFLSKFVLHKIIWRHYAKMAVPYVERFYGVLPARVDFLVNMYHLPKEKCELLVMGGDDELIEKAKNEKHGIEIRKKFNVSKEDFLVVSGGKIDLFKRQTLFLMNAIKNIGRNNVKLIVFGSIAPELKERFDLLIDNNKIFYAGWIDSKQSYDYFEAADLVVFPGRHSVFWEQATAQGKPIICKRWSGTTHVDLGGNVVFLDEDSENLIRTEILKCIDDSENFNRMTLVAENKGRNFFSYKEIAKRSVLQK